MDLIVLAVIMLVVVGGGLWLATRPTAPDSRKKDCTRCGTETDKEKGERSEPRD